MANQPIECGLEPAGDFCSCGCDAYGDWCGNPEHWTTHFGYPEAKQEKLSANYRAESIRAAGVSKAIPDRGL